MQVSMLALLLAGCGHGGWRTAPGGDPAACVTHCQARHQSCMASTGGYGDCGEGSRQNSCERITNPELRGACQTSQAFCQNRSRGAVCGERLDSCMAGCN
ncbi:hypothetical protein [Stenotrophomonas mori]|uniref:Lipoprotein n=1 Tax=Stenotrophomonas mori TaxID=2871096 RepID=A0ABT0SEW7_9GAMM|nr:hypothetical protein [Stenotrophomonas mori]MCL7713797.1 hypothetical protein [Stenotrophomonas mori]